MNLFLYNMRVGVGLVLRELINKKTVSMTLAKTLKIAYTW